MKLRALAPAKINLGLFVGGVRPDGRHELVTVFESISLADELVLETMEHAGQGPDQVICPGVGEPNLVSEALSALRARGWDGPRVRIEVTKRIPVAAGLGGGSADAAAALRMAVELAPGRPEEVMDVAAALGSDVPGQVAPGLALGTGAGDVVEPFAPLATHGLLVVPQAARLSAAEVYREADRLGAGRSPHELRERYDRLLTVLCDERSRMPAELIVNDLQAAALSLCPAIADALQATLAAGADEAFVSGSGPTVIGLFWGPDGAERATSGAALVGAEFPAAASATAVSGEFGLPLFG